MKTINSKKTIEDLYAYFDIDEEDRVWILKPLIDVKTEEK